MIKTIPVNAIAVDYKTLWGADNKDWKVAAFRMGDMKLSTDCYALVRGGGRTLIAGDAYLKGTGATEYAGVGQHGSGQLLLVHATHEVIRMCIQKHLVPTAPAALSLMLTPDSVESASLFADIDVATVGSEGAVLVRELALRYEHFYTHGSPTSTEAKNTLDSIFGSDWTVDTLPELVADRLQLLCDKSWLAWSRRIHRQECTPDNFTIYGDQYDCSCNWPRPDYRGYSWPESTESSNAVERSLLQIKVKDLYSFTVNETSPELRDVLYKLTFESIDTYFQNSKSHYCLDLLGINDTDKLKLKAASDSVYTDLANAVFDYVTTVPEDIDYVQAIRDLTQGVPITTAADLSLHFSKAIDIIGDTPNRLININNLHFDFAGMDSTPMSDRWLKPDGVEVKTIAEIIETAVTDWTDTVGVPFI